MDLKDAERPQRQTAPVIKELDHYNIDIAALQETRLEGKDSLENKLHFPLDSDRTLDQERSWSKICDCQ